MVRVHLGDPAAWRCYGAASFPLALPASAASEEEGDPGRLVGGIYAANTGGADFLGWRSARA